MGALGPSLYIEVDMVTHQRLQKEARVALGETTGSNDAEHDLLIDCLDALGIDHDFGD